MVKPTWKIFPKCKARLGYYLVVGALFGKCPTLGLCEASLEFLSALVGYLRVQRKHLTFWKRNLMLSNVCPYKTLGSFLLFILLCIYNSVLCSLRPSDEASTKIQGTTFSCHLSTLIVVTTSSLGLTYHFDCHRLLERTHIHQLIISEQCWVYMKKKNLVYKKEVWMGTHPQEIEGK